jgi:hypothetical protein
MRAEESPYVFTTLPPSPPHADPLPLPPSQPPHAPLRGSFVSSLAGATLLQYLLPARDRGAGALVVGACGDAALLEWAPSPDAAPGDGKPQARRDPPSPPWRTLHITLAIFVLCSPSTPQNSRAAWKLWSGARGRPPAARLTRRARADPAAGRGTGGARGRRVGRGLQAVLHGAGPGTRLLCALRLVDATAVCLCTDGTRLLCALRRVDATAVCLCTDGTRQVVVRGFLAMRSHAEPLVALVAAMQARNPPHLAPPSAQKGGGRRP